MGSNHSLITLSDVSTLECRMELVEFWNAMNLRDDLGGVPGELVRETEIRVTELMASGLASDLYEAHRLTARFAFQWRLH
jgi:hypothetical protein